MRQDSARLQPSARVVPQFDSSGLDPQKTKAFTVKASSDGVTRGKNARTNTGTHFSGEGRDGVVWNPLLVQQYHTDSVMLFGMPGSLVAAL